MGFRNPLILQDNVYGGWGRSYYHAMIVQLQKRFSRQFTLSAHHTWSKRIDEATDCNSSFEPHLQWDARNELARSHFHRGHRFVAHAVAQSPWKAAPGRGFGHNLLSDFTFSGIVLARSGAPFNLNAGLDNIGDRHTDTHRPRGLGRNAGTGPSFFGFDMRLSRSLSIREGVALQVVGEGFNILNKTNFKGVNGVVGDISIDDLPASLTGRRGPVTEALSFASAFDPRQFQFSLRLTFQREPHRGRSRATRREARSRAPGESGWPRAFRRDAPRLSSAGASRTAACCARSRPIARRALRNAVALADPAGSSAGAVRAGQSMARPGTPRGGGTELAVEEALEAHRAPEIFNTDQGSQFTAQGFTDCLQEAGIRISMDGRGHCIDNVFSERLRRSLKYEAAYLQELADGFAARKRIAEW